MDDLISVIVPVYNTERGLTKCVNSILSQSYRNLEIILVDDGSTDNAGAICDEYARNDMRIKVIHKSNGGPSDARNAGLSLATGDYIGFVDPDDFIEKELYETLYTTMMRYDADISMVSFYEIKGDIATTNYSSGKVEVLNRDKAMESLLIDEKVQSFMWNKLYKAPLFSGVTFPDIFLEDVYVNYELFKKIRLLACVDTPLYNYVFWPESISHRNSHQKNEDTCNVILDRFFKVNQEFPQLEMINSYCLILWSLRTYSFIKKSNDLNDGFFRKNYPLYKENLLKYHSYILGKLSDKKLRTLQSMLLEYDNNSELVADYL